MVANEFLRKDWFYFDYMNVASTENVPDWSQVKRVAYKVTVDLPGMCAVGRQLEKFNLFNLTVWVPFTDIKAIYEQLTELAPTLVGSKALYVLKPYLFGLWLDKQERDYLLELLQKAYQLNHKYIETEKASLNEKLSALAASGVLQRKGNDLMVDTLQSIEACLAKK